MNITASHNPREYNGYKAYWEDGAQVLAPHDKGIIDEVNQVKVADVKFKGNPELIEIIGEEVDKLYLDMVKTISIDPAVIERQKDLKIVYTPLHGTGMMLIPQSLKLWGFDNVHCVKEQMVRSGDFPTVVSPNPENGEALTLALRDAKEIDARSISVVAKKAMASWHKTLFVTRTLFQHAHSWQRYALMPKTKARRFTNC